MKKLLFLLIIAGLTFSLYAGEQRAEPAEKLPYQVDFRTNTVKKASFSPDVRNMNTTVLESSPEMIELGKRLTFAGLGGFLAGATAVGLGFVTGALGLYSSGFLYHLNYYDRNWGEAWSSYYDNILNIGAGAFFLLGLTLFLWITGGLLIQMIYMIIPGIIIWYKGAKGVRRRREPEKVSCLPLMDNIGVSIRFQTF